MTAQGSYAFYLVMEADTRVLYAFPLFASIFSNLPDSFDVARYHSLHGIKEHLPPCLEVTAQSDDGIIMGIKHKSLPLAAVQFHPESILTNPVHGMTILINALSFLRPDAESDG